MSKFAIAVVETANEVETLRVLRSLTATSIASLRNVIGTREPALVISTTEYPLDLDIEEGHIAQHRRIVDACDRLEMTGALLEVRYCASTFEDSEIVDRQMMMNLFNSELQIIRQEHD